MGTGRILLALGAGIAAVLAAFTSTAPVAATPGEQFAERLLAAHNRERDRVGVPRLRWSAQLSGQAQAWASELARSGGFEHASPGARSGAGENLWMGTAAAYSAEEMVGGFVDEAKDFRDGRFPDVSRTGSWHDVGHYSQLVWRGTSEVGCAVARGAENDVLVCRYWPAGNVLGSLVY